MNIHTDKQCILFCMIIFFRMWRTMGPFICTYLLWKQGIPPIQLTKTHLTGGWHIKKQKVRINFSQIQEATESHLSFLHILTFENVCKKNLLYYCSHSTVMYSIITCIECMLAFSINLQWMFAYNFYIERKLTQNLHFFSSAKQV